MDELILFHKELQLVNHQHEGLVDLYYQLTMNLNIREVLDRLSDRHRNILLNESRLSLSERSFILNYDRNTPMTSIHDLSYMAEYDYIKSKIYRFLFNTLQNTLPELLLA